MTSAPIPMYCESGNCYNYEVLTDTGRNWNDARSACQVLLGDLASINSEEEWQFVKGILTSSGVTSGVWLGASDSTTEDTWVWTDGSPVTYTDWRSSQPNHDGNCLFTYIGWNWQWGDYPCT